MSRDQAGPRGSSSRSEQPEERLSCASSFPWFPPVQKRATATTGETCGLGRNHVPFSMLFGAFKLSKLCSALKRPGNAPQAFDAVLELGRIGNAKAVDLLIGARARLHGVSRSAARELRRSGRGCAINAPLGPLHDPEGNETAAAAA